MAAQYESSFAFSEQLWYFYTQNRGKIRRRYTGLTRKFLAYNDNTDNPDAFLRRPQFEALEMYVFIKEFMHNPQVHVMFDDWRNRRGDFSDASYYSRGGALFDDMVEKQSSTLFKQMKKYEEKYPNYIYALTMGLGKTILMATCIFYEFLLANTYPKDERFCHNALVFAPDRTVLQSLREIITFDRSKVVPPEYVHVFDEMPLKFHFLDDAGTTLSTIDGSDFNIIISNTQKIIVKQRRKAARPVDALFADTGLLDTVYGGEDSDDAWDESSLIDNQRFKKLCRLPQLGVYVDEAHHLFGADLEKQIRSGSGKKTSLRDTINLLAENTSIVACYNYTGTPYVKNQMLPEVVYSHGLRESIAEGYLKDANPIGVDNVKSEEFLKLAVTRFWHDYGGKAYEGLHPKMAIYAATVEEAVTQVRPALEEILADLGVSTDRILVNVGDTKYTKDEDIRDFNNLDVPSSQGNEKQFIVLVEKGKEGWNCRSLFAVALYRSPKSKVFVLQATMRCLRQITDEKQTALVFLSKENYATLDAELHKNFNMGIGDITRKPDDRKRVWPVCVLPPERTITLKRVWREYDLHRKEYETPIDFHVRDIDLAAYESAMVEKRSLTGGAVAKETNIDYIQDNTRYSLLTLTGEISRYLNLPCTLVARILRESTDGADIILQAVNEHNEILYDHIIPAIVDALYETTQATRTEDRELTLLRPPKEGGYYEFTARDDLVVTDKDSRLTDGERAKSFHANTYCFDSLPERECFWQYVRSDKVSEVYFTGMFTANQGDLLIHYYDPVSGRIRSYYPDFLAKMTDGSYRLIEVKGDNMIDDEIVQAKKDAAELVATASGVEYIMYAGSRLMKTNVLEDTSAATTQEMQPLLPDHAETAIPSRDAPAIDAGMSLRVSPVETATRTMVLLTLDSRRAAATGYIQGDGFVVLKGSTIAPNMATTCPESIRDERRRLVETGTIRDNTFTRDTPFASPTLAASIVLGMGADGGMLWMYADGRTLAETMAG